MSKVKRKVIKLAILGDSTVGKTSICKVFFNYEFDQEQLTTIGQVRFEKKIKMKDDIELKLIIWDTAGQERFHNIAITACKSAQGILVCYDLTKRTTFDRIKIWLDEINNRYKDIPIVLLGNKCDMVDERQITEKEAKESAEKYSLPFFETSAKNKINIDEAIMYLTDIVYKKLKDSKETFSLEDANNNKDETCCLFRKKEKPNKSNKSNKKADENQK